MHVCKDWPREKGVVEYLHGLRAIVNSVGIREFRFKKWITVDRSNLVDVVLPVDEFVSTFSESIAQLTRHHYVAKAQSKFFKNLRDSLPSHEAVLVGDFSENFSFVVQDATQGFHWDNSQCTLHPFVLYMGGLHKSYCVISDSLVHDAGAVAAFQAALIRHIRSEHPGL